MTRLWQHDIRSSCTFLSRILSVRQLYCVMDNQCQSQAPVFLAPAGTVISTVTVMFLGHLEYWFILGGNYLMLILYSIIDLIAVAYFPVVVVAVETVVAVFRQHSYP